MSYFSSNTYDYKSSSNQSGTDPVAVSDFLARVNLKPSQLREIADLGAVDYLKLDEQVVTPGAIPSRGLFDDLCYGTGTTYLAGIVKIFSGFFFYAFL
jgi:import inner membrane translocase subunit TIM23